MEQMNGESLTRRELEDNCEKCAKKKTKGMWKETMKNGIERCLTIEEVLDRDQQRRFCSQKSTCKSIVTYSKKIHKSEQNVISVWM